MLAPGWGEAPIPARFRLSAALLAVLVLAPHLTPQLPLLPDGLGRAAFLLICEVLIGLILGGAARIFMSAASVAGQAAAMQTGLGFAIQVDPTMGQQGALLGAFFSLVATVLVLSLGIHRWMLEGAVASYDLFPPGMFPATADIAQYGLTAVAESFRLGMQIAAPAIAFGLIFNLALGLAARLIPQIQIFFIAMPSSIALGLIVLALGMSSGFLAWVDGFDTFLKLGAI